MPGVAKVPRLPSSASASDIEALRRVHDKVFLGRLDGILQKYDRDFQGVADEIDLSTGEIVVNNGHISGARDSYDIGRPTHRPAPYVPVEARNMTHRSPLGFSEASEDSSIVRHHYAPELHQNMQEQRTPQPDITASVLRILERIERIEARNEVFHNQIAGQLGLLPSTDALLDGTSTVQNFPMAPHQRSRESVDQQRGASKAIHAQQENFHDAYESSRKITLEGKRGYAWTDLSSASDAVGNVSPAAPVKRRKTGKKSHDVWAPGYVSSDEAESSLGSRQAQSHRDEARMPHKRPPTAEPSFWTKEANHFLINVVRNEMKSSSPGRAQGGRWKRIITAFSSRFPGRGIGPVRVHLGRIIPGGMKAFGADSETHIEKYINAAVGDTAEQTLDTATEQDDAEEYGETGGKGQSNRPEDQDKYSDDAHVDSAVNRAHIARRQERQHKDVNTVRQAKSRLAHCSRRQDQHDKRLRVPPPRAHIRSLPYHPDTPKHVRRSGRSRTQPSMRELLDQYEANFLEFESDEVVDQYEWATRNSKEETSTAAEDTTESANKLELLQTKQPEEQLRPPEEPPAHSRRSIKHFKNNHAQTLDSHATVDMNVTQATPLRAKNFQTPKNHSPNSQTNDTRPTAREITRRAATPQMMNESRASNALAELNPLDQVGQAKSDVDAHVGLPQAQAYPSPESAKGKYPENSGKSKVTVPLKLKVVPNSQETELPSSSATNVVSQTGSSPNGPARSNISLQDAHATPEPAGAIQKRDSHVAASPSKSMHFNPLSARPSDRTVTPPIKRGRGRPRKGEVVTSSQSHSAKKHHQSTLTAKPSARRRSEPANEGVSKQLPNIERKFELSRKESKPLPSKATSQKLSSPLCTPHRPLPKGIAMSAPALNRKLGLATIDDLSEDELA